MSREDILLVLSKNRVTWSYFWRFVQKYGLENLDKIKDERSDLNWDENVREQLEDKNINFLSFFSEKYPNKLRRLKYPPYVIFYRGNIDLLLKPIISIVGTRKASPQGRDFAYNLSRDIASAGYVVASGLAMGIDTWAHKGAISQGETIAVMGTSIDVVYPKSNWHLFNQICEKGLVISPFCPVTTPKRYNFPIRNAVMAAISDKLVVIEAPLKSGALITAKFALDMGIPVYAVPGRPKDPLTKGTNWLIKNKAQLLDSAEDIIGIRQGKREKPNIVLKGLEAQVFELVLSGIGSVDELSWNLNLEVATLQQVLMALEIKGLVKKGIGGFYETA